MVGKKGGVMGEENLKPIPMASINHNAARHHFFSSFTLCLDVERNRKERNRKERNKKERNNKEIE
jgi:hypothetical protein